MNIETLPKVLPSEVEFLKRTLGRVNRVRGMIEDDTDAHRRMNDLSDSIYCRLDELTNRETSSESPHTSPTEREVLLAEYLKIALQNWAGMEMTYRESEVQEYGMCQDYESALALCTETLERRSHLQTGDESTKRLIAERKEEAIQNALQWQKDRIAGLEWEILNLTARRDHALARIAELEAEVERLKAERG